MPLLANRLFAAMATGSRRLVATEHTDEALFDELDSLGKAGNVAKLLFEPRNLRSDDGVRVVRSIRQFGHGDAEQPIEARWLEMNGEVVDTSKDGQASPRVRLGTDHRDTRRGVTVIRPRAMDAVAVCEGERQKLLRPCRQRDDEWDGADPPRRHAVRPDVRPQHRTRWRHFRLEHLRQTATFSLSSLCIPCRRIARRAIGHVASYCLRSILLLTGDVDLREPGGDPVPTSTNTSSVAEPTIKTVPMMLVRPAVVSRTGTSSILVHPHLELHDRHRGGRKLPDAGRAERLLDRLHHRGTVQIRQLHRRVRGDFEHASAPDAWHRQSGSWCSRTACAGCSRHADTRCRRGDWRRRRGRRARAATCDRVAPDVMAIELHHPRDGLEIGAVVAPRRRDDHRVVLPPGAAEIGGRGNLQHIAVPLMVVEDARVGHAGRPRGEHVAAVAARE